MNVRVLSVMICPVIASVLTFSESDQLPGSGYSNEGVVLVQAEPEAYAFSLFRKKKKRIKRSGRMKRHNKSMGKKFKRKNDDTLIR